MNKNIFAILLLFNCIWSQNATLEKILFIGNSFTFYWNLPLVVESMANERGYNFDIIQFQLNVFNVNKKKINFLRKMKKKYKLEFHIRSILLQGLSLKKDLKFSKKFNLVENKINKINKICTKYKISKYNFYLSLINSLNIADYAIIGLSSIKEYEDLKNFKKQK